MVEEFGWVRLIEYGRVRICRMRTISRAFAAIVIPSCLHTLLLLLPSRSQTRVVVCRHGERRSRSRWPCSKIPSAAIAGRDDLAEKRKLLTHLRMVSKRCWHELATSTDLDCAVRLVPWVEKFSQVVSIVDTQANSTPACGR